MNNDNTAILVIVIVIVVALAMFGGYGMMGFGHMGYGSQTLCSNVGGIWCYWPNFGWLFMVLTLVVLVLFVIWIVRYIQNQGGKK